MIVVKLRANHIAWLFQYENDTSNMHIKLLSLILYIIIQLTETPVLPTIIHKYNDSSIQIYRTNTSNTFLSIHQYSTTIYIPVGESDGEERVDLEGDGESGRTI